MKLPKIFRRSLWLERVRRHFWQYLAPRWTLPSGVTIQLQDECDWITLGDLFINGEYDAAISACLDECDNTSDIQVVDLGANVGFFYLRFIHMLRTKGLHIPVHYTAVEPNDVCADRFQVSANDNSDNNVCVRLLRALVGARSGTGAFQASDFHIGSRVTSSDPKLGSHGIPYVDLLEELPEGPIALLKIDIEGSEETFLTEYGDLLPRVQNLIIEIHGDVCNAESCREKISNSGLKQVSSVPATEHYTLEVYQRISKQITR